MKYKTGGHERTNIRSFRRAAALTVTVVRWSQPLKMEMVFFEPRYQRAPCWSPWSDLIDIDAAVWDAYSRRNRASPKRRPCSDRPTPSCKRTRRQRRKTSPEPEEQHFRVSLNAAGFRPDDLSIHRSGRGITVRARSNEDGVVVHMFHNLRLPKNVRAKDLTAQLCKSGQLVLEAPALEAPRTPRKVPVTHEASAGEGEAKEADTDRTEATERAAADKDKNQEEKKHSEEVEKSVSHEVVEACDDGAEEVAEQMDEITIVHTKAASESHTEGDSMPVQKSSGDAMESDAATEDDGKGETRTNDPQENLDSTQAHRCEDIPSEADDSAARDGTVVVPVVHEHVQDVDPYRVTSDVADFQPHEVSVKVAGRVVTVTAEREENSEEGGNSSLRMVRSFTLPEGVDPDQVTSRLTPARQLVIEAPRHRAVECSDSE